MQRWRFNYRLFIRKNIVGLLVLALFGISVAAWDNDLTLKTIALAEVMPYTSVNLDTVKNVHKAEKNVQTKETDIPTTTSEDTDKEEKENNEPKTIKDNSAVFVMNDDEKRNYSDINYLKKNFYTVAAITDLLEGDIKPEEFLAMDFSLNTEEKGPKVLIFHTHSHEGYADSDMSNGLEDGIIGTGERLKDILENDYGIETMHCTQSFDYVDSKMTTTGAYERMEPVIEQILKENPSIEIAIDLHRDGVKDETVRLVTQINDKPTAQLMFFNGICRIYDGDRLIKTAGLDSPYINENLAFSFCMKYAADKLYSGLARKNYINAYRYSLNMLPKSLLVEVGAQTNTKEEAMNAMEPLAEILYSVINKNNT